MIYNNWYIDIKKTSSEKKTEYISLKNKIMNKIKYEKQ